MKKNLIEVKRLSFEIKKIKQKYFSNTLTNLKKKKIGILLMIYFRALKIISSALKLKMFERMETFKLIFWENKLIFSELYLTKRFKKNEVVFFELYHFLINLSGWEVGLINLFNKDLYLQPIVKILGRKMFSPQNKRKVESIDEQPVVQKNSLTISWEIN